MHYYFAQFLPDEDQKGVYNVSFPDLPGCCTFGKGLDGAMEAAMDALTGYLEVEMERGETVPAPSEWLLAKEKAEAEARELDIALPPETLYQLVPADPKPEPAIRLNISMQPKLVALIDRRAKEEGLTRSGLLALAAKRYVTQASAM